ncbi:MAG: hypothetical protein Q8S44_07075 [Flavobacteriaceae bacterium]|nr:hypothetical protein [Flavobacteriaceae bacterium]
MYELFKKYWKRFFLPLKIVIVFAAFYLIYGKFDLYLFRENQFKFPAISNFRLASFIFLMLIFTTVNWLLEINKWKLLVSQVVKISFYDAVIQSLSSHTVSLVTPFKSGEFGMKTMFYKRDLFKKIIDLNFIGNFSQLIITVIFGIVGFYLYQFSIGEILNITIVDAKSVSFIFFGSLILVIMLSIFIMNKLINFKIIPIKKHFHILLISMLRYLIFSHQYVFLLFIFYPNLNYEVTISSIFSMYLLASIIPTMALFDWTIKGSIAVILLSVIGFQAEIILLVSIIMWFFNFALPAILGSYFVMSFSSNKILANE